MKTCLMGWPGSFLGIVGSDEALKAGVAELRIGAGVRRIAVVCVDDMACGAAAGAVVAGMIVCAGQRHHRIDQARFLQAEEDGIGAELRAEPAVTELVVGLAGILLRDWDCLVRIFSARRVRTREGRFRAEKFPSDKADQALVTRLWCAFLQA